MLRMTNQKGGPLFSTVRRTILLVEAILLVAVFLLFYQYNVSQLTQQAKRADQKILFTHRTSAEAMHKLAYNIARQIYNDPQIAYLLYNSNYDSVQLLKSISQLNNYRMCLPYIESIYVYNGALDSITISSATDGGYDIPLARDGASDDAFFDSGAARIIYEGLRGKRRFAPVVRPVTFPDGREDVYYTFAAYSNFDDQAVSDGVLVNFSSQWLRQITEEEEDSASRTLILDGDGAVIFSPDFDEIFTALPIDLDGLKERLTDGVYSGIETVSGERVLVSALSSGDNDWLYLRMTPYQQVVMGMRRSMLLMVVMDLGLLTFGLLCVTFASRRLYTPINRISTQLDDAEKEREFLSNQRRKFTELTRTVPDEDDENQGEAGLIVLIEPAQRGGKPLTPAEREAMLELENAIIAENTDARVSAEVVQMDDGSGDVLVVTGESRYAPVDWARFLDKLNAAAAKRFGRAMRVSVSRVNRGEHWKARGYRQAREAMRYHILPRFDRLMLWEEIEGIDSSAFVYPQNEEHQMIDLIMNDNAEGAVACVDRILTYAQAYSLTAMQLTISTLTIALIDVVEDLRKSAVPVPREARDQLLSMPTLDEADGLDEIADCLKDAARRICAAVQEHRGKKYTDLLEKINQLILENYQNPECSLTFIAEQVGLSGAYISKLYKQSTLRGIPDEISACRMERARRLLIEKRELTIEQVARQVGFTSASYFSKAFRKEHGMSPNEYRTAGVGGEGGEEND